MWTMPLVVRQDGLTRRFYRSKFRGLRDDEDARWSFESG